MVNMLCESQGHPRSFTRLTSISSFLNKTVYLEHKQHDLFEILHVYEYIYKLLNNVKKTTGQSIGFRDTVARKSRFLCFFCNFGFPYRPNARYQSTFATVFRQYAEQTDDLERFGFVCRSVSEIDARQNGAERHLFKLV